MIARTRFAPSPTGSLHVGGARTALYCWLYARRTGGRFVLRIEDTDRARSTEESTRGILADLTWLGLTWDEGPGTPDPDGIGPFFQSERLPLYDRAIQALLDAGVAYEAWETPEELRALRAEAEADKRSFRYRRRRYTPEELERFAAEGRRPVVRLEVPRIPRTIHDRILGDVTVSPDDVDDLVIRKADGFPTYHFAVVVDDHHMGITQVLRGQEHLMNTAKHLAILDALGWEPPAYGHFPLIFNPGGGKMSKRDKARTARAAARRVHKEAGHADHRWLAEATGFPVDEIDAFMRKKSDGVAIAEAIAEALSVDLPPIEVLDFRRAGYVPEALLNYLALLGWNPGGDEEILPLDEIARRFDLADVNRSPARFDLDKLRAINGEYLRTLPRARIRTHLERWWAVRPSWLSSLDPARLDAILDLFLPRARTFGELEDQARWVVEAPTSYDAKAVAKHLVKGGGDGRIGPIAAFLTTWEDWSAAGLEEGLGALAGSLDVGLGRIAQPLRIALTGTAASPSIFDCLALVGREEVLDRLARLADARKG